MPDHSKTFSSSVVRQTRLFHARPTRGVLALAAAAFALGVLAPVTPAPAQATPAVVGEQIMAARQFKGIAATDGVQVRGGPAKSELAVASLRRGQEVTVLALAGEFLRILPPEGTFCLVPEANVNVRGREGDDVREGLVAGSLSVRVGSTLSAQVGPTSLRLAPGDRVRVLGEQGNYYRIEPPKMVFFYVARNDVSKGREVRVVETPRGWDVREMTPVAEVEPEPTPEPEPVTPTVEPIDVTPAKPTADEVDAMIAAGAGAADLAADPEPTPPVDVVVPTTRPSSALLTRFEEVDAYYAEQATLPLAEQPLDELTEQYQSLLDEAATTDSPVARGLLPLIETRLKTLAVRQAALSELFAIQEMRAEVADRHQALRAERAELAAQVEAARVEVYEAVGELRPSSLRPRGAAPGTRLFRLCDPQTKRTLIYLQATGDQANLLATRMNKFIGVRGTVGSDPATRLKYVTVREHKRVDPADVFGTVAAKRVPPSLIPVGEGAREGASAGL